MAKTNKQLQKEIDKLTIEKNNLVDMLEIAEKGIRGVSKILGLDGIAKATYFNDADIETIEKTIEKLQGKYEKCFEELSMKCGECEGLVKANETIVKAHNDLENKVDEQFKTIINYEKELEKQDKEIEELKEESDNNWRKEHYNKIAEQLYFARERINEQNGLIVELKEELENYSGIKIEKKQDTFVISKTANQDLVDTLSKELQSQIILKNTYKKENKRLKKRRREGRYNIDKFITNLTKGAYIYVEGASRPTKLHKRLTDAIAEKQRLADKTGKKVYILTNL